MPKAHALHLIFIHGWGMNQGIWQSFLHYCESRWLGNVTFEAIDLPGFGSNYEHDLQPYNIDAVTNYVKQVLRPNTVVVGWSMGGLVAQRLADIGDSNLFAQIQIASTPRFLQADNWPGIHSEVLEQFNKQLSAGHLRVLKRFLSIQCLGLNKPKEQMKLMLEAICHFPLSSSETLAKTLQLLSGTDLRPSAKSSRTRSLPTLRIFGEFDSLVPKRAVSLIEHLYPHDNFHLIPKASHAPFLSHPEDCFNAINIFIKPYTGQSRL